MAPYPFRRKEHPIDLNDLFKLEMAELFMSQIAYRNQRWVPCPKIIGLKGVE